MKTAFVALALAALAQAQISGIPSCAQSCLTPVIKEKTNCAATDLACICKNFSSIESAATACVITSCGAQDAINDVLPAVAKVCQPFTGAAGSATSSGTSAAETSPQTASTSASSTVASSASTGSAPTTAVTTTVTTAVTTGSTAPVTSVPTSAVLKVSPTGTGAQGGNTTTAGRPAPTNAGSAILPGLAMLALGALAL